MVIRVLGRLLLERVVVTVEAINFLVGGLLLALFVEVPQHEGTGVIAAIVAVIERPTAILALGLVAVIVGVTALAALHKRNLKLLSRVVFGFFLIRLYALLGTLITMESVSDTRWLAQAPWVFIWAAYWIILKNGLRYRDE